jgi:hypothetical protein
MSVWGGKVHCRFVVKEIVSDKTGKFHIERMYITLKFHFVAWGIQNFMQEHFVVHFTSSISSFLICIFIEKDKEIEVSVRNQNGIIYMPWKSETIAVSFIKLLIL